MMLQCVGLSPSGCKTLKERGYHLRDLLILPADEIESLEVARDRLRLRHWQKESVDLAGGVGDKMRLLRCGIK